MFSSEWPPARQCTPPFCLGSSTHLGHRELIIEGGVVHVQFQIDVLELFAAKMPRRRVDGDCWGTKHGGEQSITPERRGAAPKVGQTGGVGPHLWGREPVDPAPIWRWTVGATSAACHSPGDSSLGPRSSTALQSQGPQKQGRRAAASSPLVPGLSYTVARLKRHGHPWGQPHPPDPLTLHLLGLAARANVTSGE